MQGESFGTTRRQESLEGNEGERVRVAASVLTQGTGWGGGGAESCSEEAVGMSPAAPKNRFASLL